MAPQLWWVLGSGGDADPHNRGRTDNLLVARHAGRVWLLGSGASPAAGRALACVLRRQLGWRVTDVINPWARPELVMGNQAFFRAGVRLWAHADVAEAMRRQCPRCVERLHQRLGASAADLGADPITLPRWLLHGESGTLGPWRWWRLERAPGSVVTVWQLAGQRWWWAPGLLWGEGPPDLRDTSAPALAQALARLASLPGARARWLPTQGGWLDADAPQVQRDYLLRLEAAVRQRQEAGALETDPPAALPGLPAYLHQGVRGGMNWQRVWRHTEEQLLGVGER